MKLAGTICTTLIWTLLCVAGAAGQPPASLTGVVSDASGGRLPGVIVEVVTDGAARPTATTTTDGNGTYTVAAVRPGPYVVRFALDGFARVEKPVVVVSGAPVDVTVALEVRDVSETVSVVASDVALATTATQGSTFSNATLNQLPTASRNYTHVIVADTGVNAPLPDRTGRGLNIATNPGTQTEDASQSLNPSVNGARPTNNALRINGIDATNMLNASGGLGNSVSIPLDALEEVEVQTALPSASRGRNGGGNIELITRSGTDRFAGSAGHSFQNERLNANEFFLNRAGTPKPEFRRNDSTASLGGPLMRGRTTFFGSVQPSSSGPGTRAMPPPPRACRPGSPTCERRRRSRPPPTCGSGPGSRTTPPSRRTS